MKNKKVVWIIIGTVSIALIALAITYAYWQITASQQGVNEISSACLDISLVDAESGNTGVTLQDQYPLSDTEGMTLKPYKFTVTNNCDTAVDYQIALESIGDSTTALKASSLKVMLDGTTSLLNTNETVTPTIDGAYASHKLGMGTLEKSGDAGSSVTHELRLWIDEDAPISEVNKTFRAKVTAKIGQGIKMTIKEKILSQYGGNSSITKMDSSDIEDKIISANISQYIKSTTSYYWGTTYDLDESTGDYKLSGTIINSTLDECRNGTNNCGKYTLKNSSSETATSKSIVEVIEFQTSGNYVTANTRKYTTAFDTMTEEGEYGLYKTQDDDGTTYYFRGDVPNNYVKFGSYAPGTTVNGVKYEEETAMYWRIIRVNGDDSIRMIYDGNELLENGTEHSADIGGSAYNENSDNIKYVGYVYDDNISSTIKTYVDSWYTNNLEKNYGSYIADSIFCNDREETSLKGTQQYFAAHDRLYTNKSPKLTCTRNEDKLTVANGKLTKPIGLITADEIAMAGGVYNASNRTYYLYNNDSYYWTLSPRYVYASHAHVWSFHSGGLNYDWASIGNSAHNVTSSYLIRPVINLKADVEFEYSETEDGLGVYTIITE